MIIKGGAPDVHNQLRAAISTIGFFAFIAAIIALIGHVYINRLQTNTLETQNARFERIDRASDISQRFLAVADKIQTATTQRELDYCIDTETQALLESAYKVKVSKVRRRSRAKSNDTLIREFETKLKEHIEEGNRSLKSTFRLSGEAFYSDSQSVDRVQAFNVLLSRIRGVIGDEMLEADLLFYEDGASNSFDNQRGAYEYRQSLSFLTNVVNNFADNAANVVKTKTPKELGVLREDARHLLREFTTTATVITNKSSLMELARELYGFIETPQSIYAFKHKMLATRTLRSNQLKALFDQADIISQLATEYKEQTLIKNAEAAADLRVKTSITSIVSVIFLMFSFSALAYFFKNFIVHRLVNPIIEMTQVTDLFHRGDFRKKASDYELKELSSMASALNAFRETSVSLLDSNEELRKLSRDMENFAYAASHDLKSPLRAIANLVNFLIEDLEGKVDEESEDNLNEIVKRVNRLEKLLDDLLAYAKSEDMVGEPQRFKVEEFFRELFSLLNGSRKFELEIDSTLTEMFVFPTPFQQVLHNLLDNAIKHHDRGVGKITIGLKEDGDRYRVYLQDDGPGVDPKYHAKMFGLFQTLNPRDDREGSGMGLALIAKLVDSRKGSIKVISNPEEERGTRFEFDWPNGRYDHDNEID